jgi:hypothetical protein
MTLNGKWITCDEFCAMYSISKRYLKTLESVDCVKYKKFGRENLYYVSYCQKQHCKDTFFVNCEVMNCCGEFTCELEEVVKCYLCFNTVHSPCHYYKDLRCLSKDGKQIEYVCEVCLPMFYSRLEPLVDALSKNQLSLFRDNNMFIRQYLITGLWSAELVATMTCELKYLIEYDGRDIDKFSPLRSRQYMVNARTHMTVRKYTKENEHQIWVKDRAARKIQKGMERWMWCPYTRDGKMGIMPAKICRDLVNIGFIRAE